MIKQPIPENLLRLWGAEDEQMSWSNEVLLSEDYLSDHMDLIEVYMDCVDMMRQTGPSGDRFTALGGLYLRTFDSMSHCVRAALSGNYSGAAMYARDLLETHFLLNYLMDEPGRPEKWLRSDPDTIRRKYKPVEIRKALDKRDGFIGEKRWDHYSVLSSLGSHPTPVAFIMKRDGTENIRSGPFKHADMLKACIQEAVRITLLLGSGLVIYCNEIPDGVSRSTRLALALQKTKEKYINVT